VTVSCAPEELLLENQLCFALYAASKAMTQAYRPFLEPLGITYPQYLVFLVLWEEDNISLKRLGERLLLDSGTLTPLIKRLEKEGFVSRQRAKDDERELRLQLTQKGQDLKNAALSVPQGMMCMNEIPVADLERLRGELKALLQQLLRGMNQKKKSQRRSSPETD